ncbi:MAG: hypothetical protein U0353_15065 [Sandaracinus sp.]
MNEKKSDTNDPKTHGAEATTETKSAHASEPAASNEVSDAELANVAGGIGARLIGNGWNPPGA